MVQNWVGGCSGLGRMSQTAARDFSYPGHRAVKCWRKPEGNMLPEHQKLKPAQNCFVACWDAHAPSVSDRNPACSASFDDAPGNADGLPRAWLRCHHLRLGLSKFARGFFLSAGVEWLGVSGSGT